MSEYFGNVPQNFYYRSEFIINWRILKKQISEYIASIIGLTIESALWLMLTTGLNIALLSLAKGFWFTYTSTYVGHKFLSRFKAKTAVVTDILKNDVITLSFELSLSAFVICLLVSSVCQVLYFARYFHNVDSTLYKLIRWGVPLTVLVSYYVGTNYDISHWYLAFMLSMVSTLGIFIFCFKVTDKLIPEIGSVLRTICLIFKIIVHYLRGQGQARQPID